MFNKLINGNYRKLTIGVIIILIIILVIISMVFIFKNDDSKSDFYEKYSKKVTGTVNSDDGDYIRTSPELKKDHCYNNLCVSNLLIRYNNDTGYLTFKITNKGKNNKGGYLKIIFDNNQVIYFDYPKLKKKESIDKYMAFDGFTLSNIDSFELKNVNEKEIKKHFVS